MIKDKIEQIGSIEFRLTRRMRRNQEATVCDALVVCAPGEATVWRRLGNISLLVPGLATHQSIDAGGAPLVIDESVLCNGAWVGIDGSSGEDRLAELEQVVDLVKQAGGIAVGLMRAGSVPNVNLARIRTLYDIKINDEDSMVECIEPYLVQRIRTILREERNANHE